jgi:hopanoid biosynthesis associated protein HpnK
VNLHRRLIVNADDFGRSHSINQAIVSAHRDGILTTASLMVTGAAWNEAVELARENPRLGVGLHLTLLCGDPVLPAKEIPGLVATPHSFSDDPVQTGIKYFFRRSLRDQLSREIAAQVRRFHETGLFMDHLNGHLNLHLHPTVFHILATRAKEFGIRAMRLTRDPLWLDLRHRRGRWIYRLSHGLIFGLLSWRTRPRLLQEQIRHTGAVFGLLQTGQVDEPYLLQLLPRLPAGDSELYSHPCLEKFRNELDALVSPKVRCLVQHNSIELIRYQDL